MSNVIDLFMWGYQQHFQHSLQFEAEHLFKLIDNRISPNVFLLGILVEENSDRHKVCIEPENCGYSVHSFSTIKSLALELEQVSEEGRILHSHPIAQQNHSKKVSNKALIEAIGKILKREDLYGETEKFISQPTFVDGFLVFVILEIQKEALNRHYSLTKNRYDDRFPISRSFIESAIDTYLKECSIALKDPNRGFGAIERQPDEMLRESAKQFMYSISQAGRNFDGIHGLYDACNTIAAMKYEGAEGLGKLIVAKKDHQNIRLTLQLENPIKVSDFRKVRKFLELSTEDSSIISDSAFIYGLGEQRGKYNPKDESLFVINFISHYKWEVLHDNNPMMIVEYKQPNIPKDRIDREKFYSDFKRIFANIEKDQIDDLWDITIQATKQKHGTMLVISDKAKEESVRLGKQSFGLKPIKLTTNVINQITSIDGSVLIDRNSICYAIGVILDGLATEKGDSSRGARFNSAIRYYEHFGKNQPCVLVIISEDGMINLIPKLLPQIKHSEILEVIEVLLEVNKLEKVGNSQYYPSLNYLENHQFYLTEEECNIINTVRKEIETKNFGTVKIVRTDLKSNSEMNSSYYIEI
jgi:DNA integrity scanning protein DisA with diadenylate cyclase activity